MHSYERELSLYENDARLEVLLQYYLTGHL